ncbi:MAG: NUDIX domain-containing protein [Acutalibacteraceae bacterium]
MLIKNKRSAHWGFPKGHMEKGETREETAKREIGEETENAFGCCLIFPPNRSLRFRGK